MLGTFELVVAHLAFHRAGEGVVIGDRIQIFIEIEAVLAAPQPAGA